MLSSDNASLRPRARFELKRRYFHRGYLWPWILVLLVPFLLRVVMFYDVTFPFQSPSSTAEVVRPDEVQLYKGSIDDLEIPIIHDDGVISANDPMQNDPSHGGTENRRSTGRHLPVTKGPDDLDPVDVKLGFPDDDDDEIIEGVADEVQLRQIGEQIQAIKRWDSWEEKSRSSSEQEMANDRLDSGQSKAEKKAKDEELTVIEEESRMAADTDAARALEERMDAAEMESEGDRTTVEELEATDTRNPALEQKVEERKSGIEEKVANEERKDAWEDDENSAEEGRAAKETDVERRFADELEATDERSDVEEREAAEKLDPEEERRLEEQTQAEEEKRAAAEREAEEELMAAKEREAEEKTNAAQEQETDRQWNLGKEKGAEEERTVDEQREAAGEKNGETEDTAKDQRVDNERRNDEEHNKDADQTDVGDKNFSEGEEQKITNDHIEDERLIKLEESTEEGIHTEGQNQENGTEEKDEEKHEDSGQNSTEDLTTRSYQIQGPYLAEGECDLFDGDWTYVPDGPLYTNTTCFFIRGDHNCMSNGRPDTDHLHWRWKPRGCDLPAFDATAFLEAFKGKTIGFVGDSLARNQMQSMLCMLSLVEVPIFLQEDEFITRWLYEKHQVTLAAAWSPYLLKESEEGIMGFEKGQIVVYLDILDPVWTSMLPDCDIILLSVGQWYLKPSVYIMQDEVIGCHYCPNLNLTDISLQQAYSRGLRLALEKVGKDWKGIAILSTFSSSHAEHSPGDERDLCTRKLPLDKEEWLRSFQGMQQEMRDVVVGEFNRIVNDKSKLNNDVHLEFLDVSMLSLLRADGHPGPYYYAHPYEGKNSDDWVFNDCLHWCLPGAIDTWNQLLVKIAHKHL